MLTQAVLGGVVTARCVFAVDGKVLGHAIWEFLFRPLARISLFGAMLVYFCLFLLGAVCSYAVPQVARHCPSSELLSGRPAPIGKMRLRIGEVSRFVPGVREACCCLSAHGQVVHLPASSWAEVEAALAEHSDLKLPPVSDEPVCRVSQESILVPRLERWRPDRQPGVSVRLDGRYVITGGSGSLARVCAEWLLGRGGRCRREVVAMDSDFIFPSLFASCFSIS